MTSEYYSQLDSISMQRYLEKLTYKGEILPDPLDKAIRPYVFQAHNVTMWPNMFFGDIYVYLVDTECKFTKERMRNYKALDSYNYVLSGKVNNVLSFVNKALQVCVMTCEVQASQTLRKFHYPWVVLSTDGMIHSGHCTCMAGLGEVCSHVAALLFALEIATKEGVQGPSPTSLACLWNKPSKRVPPAKVVDIQFSHKRKPQAKRDLKISKMPSEDSIKTFIGFIKAHNPTAPFLTVLSDEETSSASEAEADVSENAHDKEHDPQATYLKTVSSEGTASASEGEGNGKDRACDGSEPCEFLRFILQENGKIPEDINGSTRMDLLVSSLKLPHEKRKFIENNSRLQAKSPLWKAERLCRLTASIFGRILRCTSRGRPKLIKQIIEGAKPFTSAHTNYGVETEKNAIEKFKQYLCDNHRNGDVLDCGLFIDSDCGFLGATPDGLVICDCCEPSVLEVKCPSRGRGKMIQDINIKDFLDEDMQLKKTHQYFDQVQGQMNICELNSCFFVVYTDKDILIRKIDYKPEFWMERRQRLINFYKNHVLPQIIFS